MTLVPLLMILAGGASLASEKDPVAEALAGMNRLRVRSGGTCHRSRSPEKTLLDVSDPKAVAAFAALIEIDAAKGENACMCCGNPSFEFYKNGKLELTLGFHHGLLLRWPQGKWTGDRAITPKSGEAMVNWLADHGVPGPKQERANNLRMMAEALSAEKRWKSAMPASLLDFWDEMVPRFGAEPSKEKLDRWNAALSKELPTQEARVLALASWYGSGRWNGYPIYEQSAQSLLNLYPTSVLAKAFEIKNPVPLQLDGLARFLAMGPRFRERPGDRKLISPALRSRLLAYLKGTGDEEKLDAFLAAMG